MSRWKKKLFISTTIEKSKQFPAFNVYDYKNKSSLERWWRWSDETYLQMILSIATEFEQSSSLGLIPAESSGRSLTP